MKEQMRIYVLKYGLKYLVVRDNEVIATCHSAVDAKSIVDALLKI